MKAVAAPFGLARPVLRDATIRGLRLVRSDPRCLRLTPGQRHFITSQWTVVMRTRAGC